MASQICGLGLGAFALGDVGDRHQLGRVAGVGDSAGEGQRVDRLAVGAPMALVASVPVVTVRRGVDRFGVGEAQVVRRHGEKALARIAVMLDRGVVDREKAPRARVDDPHRHRIGFEQQPVGFLALLELGEVGQGGAEQVVHPRQIDADAARRRLVVKRQLEALALAPGRDQPTQAFRQRLDGEAEALFAEPAPAQAFGRRAEQPGGGGVEVDDLEIGRPSRVVVDDGERHHAVVAGVEHGVDQIVAWAPLGQMDGDERRTPAVGERQSEDVVELGLTAAREIGFALARLAVGRGPVGDALKRETAIGREFAQPRFAPAAAEAFGHGAAEAANFPFGLGAGEEDDAVVDCAEAVEHQVFEVRRGVGAAARHRPASHQFGRLIGGGKR